MSPLLLSQRGMLPARERLEGRTVCTAHAEVLDAWLGEGTRLADAPEPRAARPIADWTAPRRPVELAYDTAEQGLPAGVRAVISEGSRRLMFEDEAYEVLLRVASDRRTERHELAGQVLFGGLPLPGAIVRLDRDGPSPTISTDGAGGFRLPPLVRGAYGLRIAVEGAVLTVPPIALA